MAHITLLAYKNCSMAGISGLIDAFDIANKWQSVKKLENSDKKSLFDWDIVSVDGKQVECSNKILITPNASINQIKQTDIIIVPGFIAPLDFIGKIPEKIKDWIKKWNDKNIFICSTCTGSFFLAETGILNKKTATTNWLFADYFKKLYPEVTLKPELMLTTDKNIICTGATTSYFNLSLYLIEKFSSQNIASYCSKTLLIDPSKQSQSPYMIFEFQKNHCDEAVLKAQTFLEENYSKPVSIENLASELGISLRHFMRRFKKATGDTPLLYLQKIRIEDAKQKLESTKNSIDEITRLVGYEDVNSFRKLFKKITGLLPGEYRKKFAKIL
jgi:transcriptional regulator GlxA family with amidase domain